jgi:hypothetical protein
MSSWTRPLAGLALLALVVGACGGAASPAPPTQGSGAPVTSEAPTPSDTAPPATDAPATVAPTPGGQGADIGGAAAALAGLDSYHLAIVMKMEGLESSTFSMFGDGLEMEGTIIFRPTQAADIAISMGAEGQKLEMGYRLIGDKAWVSLGDAWMESPAEDAQKTIDSFAADKMLGSFASVGGLTAVGEETRNGVETVHYSAPADVVGQALGTSIGLADATWSMDFWVAKDAGYAVAYAVVGKGASGSFEMTLDVTDINNPANAVEEPTVGG